MKIYSYGKTRGAYQIVSVSKTFYYFPIFSFSRKKLMRDTVSISVTFQGSNRKGYFSYIDLF